MSEFLTMADVLAIHDVLNKRYGGSSGVRELGALEATLYRPQSGYYEDVIQQAAALWESLSQNHPFVDGNKRVAFATTDVFLRINQVKLTASAKAVDVFIYDLFDKNQFTFAKLEPWLRQKVKSFLDKRYEEWTIG
jgi:death on curing protein